MEYKTTAGGKKIPHLKFNDNLLPVYFGIDAIEEVMKGLDHEKIASNTVSVMKKALFVGLQHGAKQMGEKFSMNLTELSDLIDSNKRTFREAWKLYETESKDYFEIVTDTEKK